MTRQPSQLLILPFFLAAWLFISARNDDCRFLTYEVNIKKDNLTFFWKDDNHHIFKSIQNLKFCLANHHQTLVFAMNDGMYKADNSPLGLYIENRKQLSALNKASAKGNFYLKPNGVFYITGTMGIAGLLGEAE